MLFYHSTAWAENIDPNDVGAQWAWGENVGWLNAEPLGNGGPGITVKDGELTEYIWAENIGWISLSCKNTSSCGTVAYGVTYDGAGLVSGYAWGENVGWISFSCENTGSCETAIDTCIINVLYSGLEVMNYETPWQPRGIATTS